MLVFDAGWQAGADQAASAAEASRPESKVSTILRMAAVGAVALLAANCSSQQATKVDPKLGVAPSPVVVSDGREIPKGGGREMVGRPYTIAGRTFVPKVDEDYSKEGLASWYGAAFHGRQTANGEVFDKYAVTAAHPTMPLPSYARVTNLTNNRSLIVRVNDRGPFHGNRVVDVSRTVAEALDFRRQGVARVRVDYVGPASVDGSNDRTLISTLRSDGMMAQLPSSGTAPVMVASAEPAPQAQPATVVATAPVAAAASQAPATPTSAQVVRATTVEVPLPPERPAELARGRSAPMTVAQAAAPRPPQLRPTQAGIFFADPARTAGAFDRGAPFDKLAPLDLASLRRFQ